MPLAATANPLPVRRTQARIQMTGACKREKRPLVREKTRKIQTRGASYRREEDELTNGRQVSCHGPFHLRVMHPIKLPTHVHRGIPPAFSRSIVILSSKLKYPHILDLETLTPRTHVYSAMPKRARKAGTRHATHARMLRNVSHILQHSSSGWWRSL